MYAAQFYNTALAILFVNANFNESGLGITLFNGSYNDFSYKWYRDISTVFLTAAVVFIFMPFIEYVCVICWHLLRILWDRRCRCSRRHTKKQSVAAVVDLLSGPENHLSYRYSHIVSLVFITMVFGVGIPILFPITLIAVVVQYVFERLLTVYYYSKPIMKEDIGSEASIAALKWCVLLYTFIGYWMLSSKQIFHREVASIRRRGDLENNHHSVYELKHDHSYALLLAALILLFLMILTSAISFMRHHLCPPQTSRRKLRKARDFPSNESPYYKYYESMYGVDIAEYLAEEKHFRNKF